MKGPGARRASFISPSFARRYHLAQPRVALWLGTDWAAPLLLFGSLAAYYFAPILALSVLCAAAFFLAARRWPEWGLVAVLFTAPLYRFPKSFNPQDIGLDILIGRTASVEIALAEFAVLASFAAWLSLCLAPLETQRRMPGLPRLLQKEMLPYTAPAVGLLLTALLSLAFSEHQKFALREFRTVVLEPLLFYVVLLDVVTTKQQVSRMLRLFVLLGAALAVAALYHYYFVGVIEATGGVRRILAIYHSPNALALFLGRIMPVALALGITQGALRGRWTASAPHLLALAPMVFVLYLTFSRGAWLAISLTLVLMLLGFGRRKTAAIVLVFLAAVAVLLVALFQDRALSSAPIVQRLYVWQAAVSMLKDSPIMGVGLDNFLYHYPNYMLPEAWREPNVSHPHNMFLDFWLRLGILGVAVLLLSQGVFWRRSVHLFKRARGEERGHSLALMGSMTSFLVHGFIDNSFFLIDLAYIFWFTMGLTAALDRNRDPESS